MRMGVVIAVFAFESKTTSGQAFVAAASDVALERQLDQIFDFVCSL